MSPLRSSAGPATWRMPTPSSLRTICASDVLPSPGGPASRRWSSASPRALAASRAIDELLLDALLADEVVERARAGATARAPPRRRPHRREELRHAAARSACAHLLVDGQVGLELGERALGVDERPAELDERVAGGEVVAAAGAGAVGDGELVLQLEHDPLRRLAARRRESPRTASGRRARSRAAALRASSRRRSRARPSGRRPRRRAAARTARARRPTRSRRAAATSSRMCRCVSTVISSPSRRAARPTASPPTR